MDAHPSEIALPARLSPARGLRRRRVRNAFRTLFTIGLASSILAGCGGSRYDSYAMAPSADSMEYASEKSAVPASSPMPLARTETSGMMGGMMGRGGPNVAENMLQEVPSGAIAKAASANRKIIYTATVDLITDDLNALEPKLLAMIAEAGGFVAETNQSGAAGGQRVATWRVRVPVDKYDGFLQKTRTLGEVQSVRVDSQDVTEEFVDVSARVGAKKVQEQRLIDLIKNATAELEDVLKVEAELARVRSEIERMEGRLRFLKDQTDLTTVTVSVREVKNYVPPEAPTFATKIQRVWTDSTQLLQRNMVETLLAVVAWAPFLPFYVVGWGFAFWLLWRVWRKIRPMAAAAMNRPIHPNVVEPAPHRTDLKPPEA